MKPDAIHRRLDRLQRECNVSIGPLALLSAAFAAIVVVLGLTAVLDETMSTPTQAVEPAGHTVPPASQNVDGVS